MKPRIFIGSSSENKEIAEAIYMNLTDISFPEIWDQSLNHLSKSTLTNLVKAIETFDFAIFIFGAEDTAMIRKDKVSIVRDNVIFETGLFMGRLGIDHVFFVKPQSKEIHMPSDLLGLTYGEYDIEHPNKVAALRPFSYQVKEQIKQIYSPEIPSNGYYGVNILDSNLNDLKGNSSPGGYEQTYGMYAKTSSSQEVSVKIIKTSHNQMFDPWYFDNGQVQGWMYSMYNGKDQAFTLPPNMKGSLKIFFVGSGSATVIISLNGKVLCQKEIVWRQ